MGLNMKNMVLLAMKQTAKGTPATPTGAVNAILCRGLMPSTIKGKFVERNLIQGAKGNFGALFASGHRQFEFEVELAGSGAAGTAPKFAPLLLGCDFSETLTASISAVYQPVAGVGGYMTLIANLDGVEFKLTDARGSVSLSLNAEEIPVMKFTFIGKYSALTDTAFPAGVVFTGFQQPLTVGHVNTPTFTLGGIAVVLKSFGLDMANAVVWKDFVNDSGVRVADRKPTANASFELTTVAARNWVEDVRLGTVMALNILHGTTAGNRVGIACPKLQFSAEPSLADEEGTAMLSGSFAVMPNAGNDELVLTFT